MIITICDLDVSIFCFYNCDFKRGHRIITISKIIIIIEKRLSESVVDFSWEHAFLRTYQSSKNPPKDFLFLFVSNHSKQSKTSFLTEVSSRPTSYFRICTNTQLFTRSITYIFLKIYFLKFFFWPVLRNRSVGLCSSMNKRDKSSLASLKFKKIKKKTDYKL